MGTAVEESVRALLQGDLRDYPERTSGLDEQGWSDFGELVGSAFHRAVVQRFRPDEDGGEIAMFVEEARQPYVDTPVDVDGDSAQALIRSVFGDTQTVAPVLERFDEPDLARIELVLLRRLIADAGLTGQAFEEFLEASGSDAEPWTGSGDSESPAEAPTTVNASINTSAPASTATNN